MPSGVYERTEKNIQHLKENHWTKREDADEIAEKRNKKISKTMVKFFQSKKGEETKQKMSESHKGKYIGRNHPNWKGNNASYNIIHEWIRKHWGVADHCEVCGNTNISARYEWHNKDRKYKRIREDWIQVCYKCHRKLDKQLNEGRRIYEN